MFVDITDFKSAIAVENILTPYKKGRLASDKKMRLPKEKITPDVCLEVLKSTNYARNIKDMLLCIAELPQAEQAQFKDVVLDTFHRREQPEVIWDLGRKLAQNSQYESELDTLAEFENGRFLLSASHLSRGIKTPEYKAMVEEIDRCDKIIYLAEGEVGFNMLAVSAKIVEIPNADEFAFYQCDLQNVQQIKLKNGAKVDFNSCSHLPERLDLSACGRVIVVKDADCSQWIYQPDNLFYAYRNEDLPETLDCSDTKNVMFDCCHFEDVKKMKLADEARVSIFAALTTFPSGLDFSECKEISIERSALPEHQNFTFRDGAEVCLKYCKGFAHYTDFSKCSKVNLYGVNRPSIGFIKKVRNADEKNRNRLREEPNLPDNLDFSSCDDLNIGCCNLINQPQLRFKEGAKVKLDLTVNLPKDIDFSPCAEVSLCAADLEGVKKLHFRKGAKVKLDRAVNLPEQLDFSQCDEVSLRSGPDFFDYVKKMVFKNEEQFTKSGCILLEDWKGELVFADELSGAELSMLRMAKVKGGR